MSQNEIWVALAWCVGIMLVAFSPPRQNYYVKKYISRKPGLKTLTVSDDFTVKSVYFVYRYKPDNKIKPKNPPDTDHYYEKC